MVKCDVCGFEYDATALRIIKAEQYEKWKHKHKIQKPVPEKTGRQEYVYFQCCWSCRDRNYRRPMLGKKSPIMTNDYSDNKYPSKRDEEGNPIPI